MVTNAPQRCDIVQLHNGTHNRVPEAQVLTRAHVQAVSLHSTPLLGISLPDRKAVWQGHNIPTCRHRPYPCSGQKQKHTSL